jgi:hypothetical protein
MNPINDLSFWEELQNQYQKVCGMNFLCHRSAEFNLAWSDPATREQLHQLAEQYYTTEGHQVAAVIPREWENESNNVLFNTTSPEDDFLIRQAFIQWNINRLTS